MRRIGIVIALIVAATLGYAGTASAQEPEDICAPIDQAAEGWAGQAPAEDPESKNAEPVTSTLNGASASCHESAQNSQVRPSALLCGAAHGLGVRPGNDPLPLGEAVQGANDGLAGQIPEGGDAPIGFEACLTTPTTTPSGGGGGGGAGGGGGGAPGAQVAGLTAAAPGDGSLPRTGGELFAGAGFALMSLGALVRRFLP